LILASRPNVYSSSPLDRVGTRREDAAWIEERLTHPDSLFVPVWRNRNLVRGMDEAAPEAVFISGETAAALRMHGGPWAFLGLHEGQAVFAVDISNADDPVPLLPEALGKFVDLRSVGWGVPKPEAAVLAHARGLMHWRARHRFCGVCGAACEVRTAGHMMLCTACETQHFPRTDPAVIMLVHHGDKCLLGRGKQFPRGMHSTLAGFVEPGESFEDAVAREVYEEVKVRVKNVIYRSSQPWPFPASVMIGFHAEAESLDYEVNLDELAEARWMSREDLKPENLPKDGSFFMPRRDSIARRLIEEWLGHEAGPSISG